MRSYSITRHFHTNRGPGCSRMGSVIATGIGHALESAIRLWGPAEYTALELPLDPYGFDGKEAPSLEPNGHAYPWVLSWVGSRLDTFDTRILIYLR